MSSLNNTGENDMRMITLKKNKLLVTHYFFTDRKTNKWNCV